jgi:hypothetical protein
MTTTSRTDGAGLARFRLVSHDGAPAGWGEQAAARVTIAKASEMWVIDARRWAMAGQ